MQTLPKDPFFETSFGFWDLDSEGSETPDSGCNFFSLISCLTVLLFSSLAFRASIETRTPIYRPPKSPKSLKNKSPRASGPRVSKKSRKESKSLKRVSKRDFSETFLRLFGSCRDFLDTPGPEAQGDCFETFWGFRARRAWRLLYMAVRVLKPATKPGRSQPMCQHLSGKRKQHKHKLFGPDFPRTFLTLTPESQGSKSFSPPPGPQENAFFGADVHDFWCGRP